MYMQTRLVSSRCSPSCCYGEWGVIGGVLLLHFHETRVQSTCALYHGLNRHSAPSSSWVLWLKARWFFVFFFIIPPAAALLRSRLLAGLCAFQFNLFSLWQQFSLCLLTSKIDSKSHLNKSGSFKKIIYIYISMEGECGEKNRNLCESSRVT